MKLAIAFCLFATSIHPSCSFAPPLSKKRVFQHAAPLLSTQISEDTNQASIIDYKAETERLLNANNPEFVTDNIYTILNGWARTETLKGAKKAEQLLEHLQNLCVPLTSKHYTIVMDAWGKAGCLSQAKDVFHRMMNESDSNPALAPNRVTYNVLINAHIRAGRVAQAIDLLKQMEGSEVSLPLTMDYNMVLSGLARAGDSEKAENLLKYMVDRCILMEKTNGPQETCDCEPDLTSYNHVLEAHANSGKKGAGKRACDILDAIQAQYDRGDFAYKPNAKTYGFVMQAIMKNDTKGRNSVEEIEAFYNHAKESLVVDSDLDHLHCALLVAYTSHPNFETAEKAENVLDEMERAGTATLLHYNKVLKIWKNCGSTEGIARAQQLLERMERRKLVDRISYTTVIGALAQKGDKESAQCAYEILEKMEQLYKSGNASLKPNAQTLNSVILAWVRSGNVRRAEHILNQMEKCYEAGDLESSPSVVSYSTVMDGWAKSGDKDSAERTEEVFGRMVAAYQSGNTLARPNGVSYITLINAYAKRCSIESAQKAEDALFKMYEEYKNSDSKDMKPNTQAITVVIDAWQKSGARDAGEKAERLLNWMIDLYDKEKDESLRPNEYSFSSAISAWGKSRKVGKAVRAREILQKMVEMYESGVLRSCPNAHCYTAVISSCAHCENDEIEKRRALAIAIATYKELTNSQYDKPNQITFSTLLTALRNLLPQGEERAAAIRKVFQSAAKEGCVDQMVIKRMESALTKQELLEFFSNAVTSDGQVQLDMLPNEWRRNATATAGAAVRQKTFRYAPRP